MHGKLALILAIFVTVIGALGQAPALASASDGPAAPSGLAAARAGSSVSLTWTNNATIPAATAAQIERATDAGFTQNVTTFAVGPNATSYTDSSVVAGATYRYRVLAQNLAGSSAWSNVVSILRPGTSAPVSFFGPQFACGAYCAASFGWAENTAVTTADNVPSSTSFTNMLRVTYPAGSLDSGSVTTLGTPLGGAQAAIPFTAGATSATTTLRYYMRPQPGFQSIRGGKLPGLYGGNTSVASGGHDPDGTNGWSGRLMWRNDNNGEVYAYLAGTDGYGLQLGCGNWTWQPGKWTKVQETVHLNTPGQANGYIIVYINGVPALDAVGLTFRTVSSLQINGLYLSTFFGGSDKTWATPQTQYVDFAGFGVTSQPLSAPPTAACKVLVSGTHSYSIPAENSAAKPAAPSALVAARSGSSASLTWTNNATIPAATAIQIERATDTGFTQNLTTFTVGPNATSHTDKSVAPDTTYRYRVLAQNGASASPWSNVVSFMRPSTATPVSFFGSPFACARYCDGSFGWNENTSVVTADSVPAGSSFTNMLRITYPKGSIDSHAVTKHGTPLGGAQAAVPFAAGGTSAMTTLRYYVRPQLGFKSIRGGKLPGLYGGSTTVASGGHDPDGTNGWSARLMWRNDNNGEVYAYLADTDGYGLQLGCGNWTWQPGKWTKVQETVRLNTPGMANGSITVYINGKAALDALGLKFRTVSSLQIKGLFFSTFFGGSDKTWATPQAQHLDFAGFAVTSQPLSAPPAAACTVRLGGSRAGGGPESVTEPRR